MCVKLERMVPGGSGDSGGGGGRGNDRGGGGPPGSASMFIANEPPVSALTGKSTCD